MEVGTRFKALHAARSGDVTADKEYVIAGLDEDNEPYFIDDAGDRNFSVGHPAGDLEPYGYEVLP